MSALNDIAQSVKSFFRARSSHIGTLLEMLAEDGAFGQPRVIFDREGKSPYLSRYYLIGKPFTIDGSNPIDATGNPKPEAIFPEGLAVYIHKFHRSDDDEALHNHPWRWALSLILAGGYKEQRRVSVSKPLVAGGDTSHMEVFEVQDIEFLPGDVNVLTDGSFHRVDLLEEDSWSLFIAGPKVSSWGFWDRAHGLEEYVPWVDFIRRIRGGDWRPEKESARRNALQAEAADDDTEAV